MRGPHRWAQSCGAQNRGEAPSPVALRATTSPRAAGRGENKCVLATPPRPSFANVLKRIASGEWRMGGSLFSLFAISRIRSFSRSNNNKREAERRQAHSQMIRISGCGARVIVARSPDGVPPRLSPGGSRPFRSAPGQASMGRGRSASSYQARPNRGAKDSAPLNGRYPPLPVPVQGKHLPHRP
jgi:hypothetical protein